MNKILFENDSLKSENINSKNIELVIEPKNDFFTVNSFKFYIHDNCNLEIEYSVLEDCKLNIFFYIDKNVKFNLYEKRSGKKTKVQYKYYLEENVFCNIYKFNDTYSHRELDIINLDGNNSAFNSYLKTISKDSEKYDMMIYHNNSNTNSNIVNNGVTIIEGQITFNVTSVIPNKIKGCIVNQNNHIINFNNKKCQINPNLLIDENDVIANHSAYIGKFNKQEIFYLQRLGISMNDATKLLVKGFLTKDLDINNKNKEEIKEIIDQYWR